MAEVSVNTDWSYRGMRTVALENGSLRVIILPEAGAKIWQITYKPLDAALLWNNPRIAPERQAINTRYDDVWSGGWDELFPNDEAAVIAGEPYPDHGELWTGDWRAEVFGDAEQAGVKLRFTTPVSSILVEKTIVLRRGEARLRFEHRFTNVGGAPFPFLWKLHPALAVTPQHRLDFPPMKVVLEPAFPGTLEGAPLVSDWPHICLGRKRIDLRCVPPLEQRQLYFFYGTEMRGGWCTLTNSATRLACGLQFDPSVFPCAWLFATYGGWRNYNVAVLEPCTGYPLNFAAMEAAGRQRTLAPGESLSTQVLFTVQEGLRSVGNIDEQGRMIEAKGD